MPEERNRGKPQKERLIPNLAKELIGLSLAISVPGPLPVEKLLNL
jgi:hypothetical protein